MQPHITLAATTVVALALSACQPEESGNPNLGTATLTVGGEQKTFECYDGYEGSDNDPSLIMCFTDNDNWIVSAEVSMNDATAINVTAVEGGSFSYRCSSPALVTGGTGGDYSNGCTGTVTWNPTGGDGGRGSYTLDGNVQLQNCPTSSTCGASISISGTMEKGSVETLHD